jgi:hypothetical protein
LVLRHYRHAGVQQHHYKGRQQHNCWPYAVTNPSMRPSGAEPRPLGTAPGDVGSAP